MKRHGNYRRVVPEGQVRVAVELYRDHRWTLDRIAERYGVTRQAIWKLLHRRGVELRPRWPLKPTKSAPRDVKADRDDAGVIVTAREQQSGELYVLHEPGLRIEALRSVARRIDLLPGDWRIICYSTPETIRADLDGTREWNRPPEPHALGAIGRHDLLDPSLGRTVDGRYS